MSKVEKKAHRWERDEHDWYVEPEWTDQRLFDEFPFPGPILDPACGMGRVIQAARDHGHYAIGQDIVQRGYAHKLVNYLEDDNLWRGDIVSNPPYRIAREFAEHAVRHSTGWVALLLPLNFICGNKRAQWLAGSTLQYMLVLAPRPSMPPGRVILDGKKPGGGTQDFAWFIWAPEGGKKSVTNLSWLRRDE